MDGDEERFRSADERRELEWISIRRLARRVNAATVGVLLSTAVSAAALTMSVRAADEAWEAKECSTVVAEVHDLGEIRAAADRVLSGNLTQSEALMLRARLIVARANLVAALRQRGECVDDLEKHRVDATLNVVQEALEVLRKLPALLPRPTGSPSPSPGG
ncbi:hypothetical protein ACF1G0_34365 [Streptomyces sp. NPDC013953]|uniref:hypothetical protein n=1 Tax=Streptomyces sp. NPDC013953 TaxID=3364868 RepID=UPI0036FA3A79